MVRPLTKVASNSIYHYFKLNYEETKQAPALRNNSLGTYVVLWVRLHLQRRILYQLLEFIFFTASETNIAKVTVISYFYW